MKSALGQKANFKFNVIVVNNHSTDRTGEILDELKADNLIQIVPERTDLGIGGCWNEAINSSFCGKFAVQLDSDDLYSSPKTLQKIVDAFYKQKAAMIIGSYRMCDFDLNTLPPGLIDHKEWTDETDATMRCVSTDWVLRAPSLLRWSDKSSFLTPRMVRIMRSAWHFAPLPHRQNLRRTLPLPPLGR